MPEPVALPDCITDAQRAEIDRADALFTRQHPEALSQLSRTTRAADSSLLYTFWPQGGILWKDLFISNFVDLDPTEGIKDFHCGTGSYDGHKGIDCSLHSFGKQEIGMPIFAALDGLVTAAHDGEEDHNTVWNGQPANYVVVTSADNRKVYYYHMRKGSVAVQTGDTVVAGQQIGLVGSSGISTGPHLHFETRFGTTVVEPFAGPCGGTESLFADQPEYSTAIQLQDVTLTSDDLAEWEGLPYETSRTGYVGLGSHRLFLWMNIRNFPADCTYRIRYVRANGTVRYDSGRKLFRAEGNPPYRSSTWWFRNTIDFDMTGDWKIEVTLNDTLHFAAPLTVTASTLVNRPPYPIEVEITPESPEVDSVIGARISNWNFIDEPDYDLIAYNYVWTRDGQEIRNVVSCGLADYLPRTEAVDGATIECTVTASDGKGGMTAPATDSILIGNRAAVHDWALFW